MACRPETYGSSNWYQAVSSNTRYGTGFHARRLERSHGDAVRALIGRVALLELATPVLARALDPFPMPVRTLDALHLASIEFLRVRQQHVELASYDERLTAGARALHIPLYETC